MKIIIILSLFALAKTCKGYHSYNDEENGSYIVNPFADKKCEKEGLLCKNCNTLVRCMDEGHGLIEMPYKKCKTGEYCYSNLKCSNETYNPICQFPNYKFKCTNTGIFPDPFNPKKYYICVKSGSSMLNYPFECNSNWCYNMKTTYCDISDEKCDEKLPVAHKCAESGESGALEENKSLWYLCVEDGSNLVPELHLCPNGREYKDGICQKSNNPTTPDFD